MAGGGHKKINTLRPRQNGRNFADDFFKCIFLNKNDWIPIKIPLEFVSKGPINNIPALAYIMAWRCPGDKPISEPMVLSLPKHICVTRPQWVKGPPTWLKVVTTLENPPTPTQSQSQSIFIPVDVSYLHSIMNMGQSREMAKQLSYKRNFHKHLS